MLHFLLVTKLVFQCFLFPLTLLLFREFAELLRQDTGLEKEKSERVVGVSDGRIQTYDGKTL